MIYAILLFSLCVTGLCCYTSYIIQSSINKENNYFISMTPDVYDDKIIRKSRVSRDKNKKIIDITGYCDNFYPVKPKNRLLDVKV